MSDEKIFEQQPDNGFKYKIPNTGYYVIFPEVSQEDDLLKNINTEDTYELSSDDPDATPEYVSGNEILDMVEQSKRIHGEQDDTQAVDETEDVQGEREVQAQEQSEAFEVEETSSKKETPNAEDKEQPSKSTEANDINPKENVDIPIKTSVIAKPYDIAQQKAAKLEDKNIKLAEKNSHTNVKLARANDYVSQCDALIYSKIFPAPVEMIIKIFCSQQNDKIAKYDNKLKARNAKIEKNTTKIDEQRTRMSDYKMIDEFLVKLKTPEGRRENYIAGIKKFKEISIEKTKNKIDILQSKIDKAQERFSKTRFVQEKQKLSSKLDRYREKMNKLTAKLDNFKKFDERILWVQKAPMKDVNKVVQESCENIVNAMANDPESAKNPAEAVVVVCIKVMDTEKIKSKLRETIAQPKIDILGLYRRDNGDEFIHFSVNRNGKREEFLTSGACTWSDNRIEERLSSLRGVDNIDIQKMESRLNKSQPNDFTAQAINLVKQNQQQAQKQQIKPIQK